MPNKDVRLVPFKQETSPEAEKSACPICGVVSSTAHKQGVVVWKECGHYRLIVGWELKQP